MNLFLSFIGSLGGQELIIVFLIVLLLFGAKKLPELARGVGKSMGEFKKAREDFESEIHKAESTVTNKREDTTFSKKNSPPAYTPEEEKSEDEDKS